MKGYKKLLAIVVGVVDDDVVIALVALVAVVALKRISIYLHPFNLHQNFVEIISMVTTDVLFSKRSELNGCQLCCYDMTILLNVSVAIA